MKAVKTRIDGIDLLIQTLNEPVELASQEPVLVAGRATEPTSRLSTTSPERQTSPTGIKEEFAKSYDSIRTVIAGIARDIGGGLAGIASTVRPREVEMEFNIAFETGTNMWVVTGKGEVGLKVTLKWDLAATPSVVVSGAGAND